MQEIIDKSKQLTALLIEYRESLKYGSCKYHIVEQPDRKGWFFLFDIKTEQIVKTGTPDTIKAWLRLRKIEPETVYNYGLMPEPLKIACD